MSEIALYEALKLIPNITDEQAKAAVADLAKKEEVATKSDIKDLELRLTNRMYGAAGVIIAAVALIVKYL